MRAISASLADYFFKNQTQHWQNPHKYNEVFPMRDLTASTADYLFINQTQYWNNLQINPQGIPCKWRSCLNGWLFLHKPYTILTIWTIIIMRDELWGPYLPQYLTVSSQIKHNLHKLHEKIQEGWPMRAVAASIYDYCFTS